MRWGVRDEATDDHMTTELCMKEIENCQRLSMGPNFVVGIFFSRANSNSRILNSIHLFRCFFEQFFVGIFRSKIWVSTYTNLHNFIGIAIASR